MNAGDRSSTDWEQAKNLVVLDIKTDYSASAQRLDGKVSCGCMRPEDECVIDGRFSIFISSTSNIVAKERIELLAFGREIEFSAERQMCRFKFGDFELCGEVKAFPEISVRHQGELWEVGRSASTGIFGNAIAADLVRNSEVVARFRQLPILGSLFGNWLRRHISALLPHKSTAGRGQGGFPAIFFENPPSPPNEPTADQTSLALLLVLRTIIVNIAKHALVCS